MPTRRLCPLCEAEMVDVRCRVHDVPTIAIGLSRGPPAKLEVGTIIVDRYAIEGLLSQGGMGALLRARDLETQQTVVVKVLRGQRISELQNVRRFYQEARVASSLHHPNIVRIIEFGVDEATRAPFLAMEYVEGQTFKALIANAGALSEVRTASLFVQISRALLDAHDHGILHRDLKPSNVMVSELLDGDEVVKVLDFGLAKILQPDDEMPPLTQPGKTVGTPAYMSPEQVTQRPQDFRSDLYGVGCMLHTALTGAPPFTGDDLIQVMRKQMRDPPPPLPSRLFDGRAPSPALVNIHRALLKKAKNERPGSTEEVVRAFEHILSAQGRSFTTTPKEPRHEGIAILDADTRIEGQAAVSTKPAHDHVSDSELMRAFEETHHEPSPSSNDAATVLTSSYNARGESATMLGGVPIRITPPDELRAVARDPAGSEELEFDATSQPEPTDPDRGVFHSKESTDPERTTGNRQLGGFVEPELPSGVRSYVEDVGSDTDSSALETMRGHVDELGTFDASSEDVLTTILPSELDGSEVIEAPTPLRLDAGQDEASDTRRLDTEAPEWPIPKINTHPEQRPEPHPADVFLANEPERESETIDQEPPTLAPPVRPAPAPEPVRGRSVILWLAAAALLVAATALIPAIRNRLERSRTPALPSPPTKTVKDRTPTIVPRIRQVWVDSVPTGAAVFIGDVRLGETPLVVDAPTATRILRLTKKGYRSESVELRVDVADSLEVKLKRVKR